MTDSGTADALESPINPRPWLVVFACAIVLIFRFAAWRTPSSYIVIPESMTLPIGAMGVLFLVCGVWVWLSRPSALTRVFLLTGIGGGIHWGGSIGAESTGVQLALVTFYVSVTAMGDGAFLDLALRYPNEGRRPRSRTIAFYLLAILMFLAIPIVPFLPAKTAESVIGLAILVAFAMSILGGVVFIVKWFRATADARRAQSLTAIAAVLILTSVLDLLGDGGVLPGIPEAWSLSYAATPMVLAWALMRLPAAAPSP